MSVSKTVRGPYYWNSLFSRLSAALLVRSAFAILRYGFAFQIGQDRPYLSMSLLIFFTFITTGGFLCSRDI